MPNPDNEDHDFETTCKFREEDRMIYPKKKAGNENHYFNEVINRYQLHPKENTQIKWGRTSN